MSNVHVWSPEQYSNAVCMIYFQFDAVTYISIFGQKVIIISKMLQVVLIIHVVTTQKTLQFCLCSFL